MCKKPRETALYSQDDLSFFRHSKTRMAKQNREMQVLVFVSGNCITAEKLTFCVN